MFPQPQRIATNGIELAVHEQGQGEPVVFLHGFPELAYSWRFQLPAVAAAGFRAIAPDLRGYGGSDKPAGVENYTMQKLMADITGLLDSLELDAVHLVAHDWGALLGWQLALHSHDRLLSLVTLNIPHFPRPPFEPVAAMRATRGDDFYIVNFQDSDAADRKCGHDPARVFDVMMRTGVITREQFEQLPASMQSYSLLAALDRTELSGEPLLSSEEKQVYVDAFTAGGFTSPINYYRNWTHNWQVSEAVEQTVRVPTLFIGAVNDVIISPEQIEAMRPYVANLKIEMLENCGHWSQQEKPDEVNTLLLDWLRSHSATT